MGIYGALSSAVTGLRAQSHALENISGNIANSQTTGYKRMETSFLDLIPDAPLKSQVPGAVLAQSRGTNNIQGDIQTSSMETFIALNTSGFFVVEPKVGQSDGNSVFAGSNYFTRRGDFEIDKDGLLVNGAGYYLKGLKIDPGTGNISSSVPAPIQLSNAFLEANRTTTINYKGNLPQLPKTANYKPTDYNSELLQTSRFAPGSTSAARSGGVASTDAGADAVGQLTDGSLLTFDINGRVTTFEFIHDAVDSYTGSNTPIDVRAPIKLDAVMTAVRDALRETGGAARSLNLSVTGTGVGSIAMDLGSDHHASFTVSGTAATQLGLTGPTTPPNRTEVINISHNDASAFVAQSISGGAVTVFASNGAPANVQLRWAKVDSKAAGGEDTWQLFYLSDSNAVGTGTEWKAITSGTPARPIQYQFDDNGSIIGTDKAAVEIKDLTVNGVNVGDVILAHDTNGMSQFADVNGTVSVSTLNQNGYGAGEFLSVAITDSGRVVATYSNGERIEMAQVVTAQFNGVNSLKRLDGGVYQSTAESGEPILDLSGTGIIGGALEASNTDISDEFTKLIITQQAYSAGTRIVSTADEMLQEALNMVR
jgi:fagellar hook-basal body proteins